MYLKRDWISLIVGWIAGAVAFFLIPNAEPKLALVFLAGFAGAWVVRAIMA